MVPKLVNDHDAHVCLQVRFAIEMLSHRRFLGSLVRDVLVTVDSTMELLFHLAYVVLVTPPARDQK